MQAHVEPGLLETPDGPFQAIQSFREPLPVDFVMPRALAPRFLAQQNRVKAASPRQRQRLVELRFAEIGEEQVGPFHPGRLLVPHPAQLRARQAGGDFKTLNHLEEVGFAAGDDAESRRFEAMRLLGLRAQLPSWARTRARGHSVSPPSRRRNCHRMLRR